MLALTKAWLGIVIKGRNFSSVVSEKITEIIAHPFNKSQLHIKHLL